nr:MAG TPA: hypothetical protein [Caudoviricetes sp.]
MLRGVLRPWKGQALVGVGAFSAKKGGNRAVSPYMLYTPIDAPPHLVFLQHKKAGSRRAIRLCLSIFSVCLSSRAL